ncbi:ATP-binding protein [Teichococcus oryzae]|uniref:histidine kinase n=1 Tax=Teichococcus oryzae TaxID=1608942 RepID=A0A5B2TLX0_9PROT|nr:ATP-binding protein [Pseudoroseomonas oryzae]KAA2215113.1 response regulator [Pseudoroseomonas oryzae]
MRLINGLLRRRGKVPDTNERQGELFNQLPDAALLLDGTGCAVAANLALKRALGPTMPVRRGMAADRIFAAASRPAFQAWWADRVPEVELSLAAPDGHQAPLMTPVRIVLEDGACVLLLRDVTQRQAMAAQLAEADRLQALGTLAGGIAHDFNNLLAVIVSAADQALQQNGPMAEEAIRADLRQVSQAAERGAALVRQLLAYARQQVLTPRLVPLNQAVRGIAGLLQPLLGQRIDLELKLDEPERQVRIDPSQLDRVLMNLAMNARQAMPDGGTLTLMTGRALLLEPLRAEPEDVPPGRWTMLEVADTGHGIPAGLLPRIFQPFFTSRAQQGGTGMGLATVHGIVRQSGGYLLVESEVGRGTRIRILLPRIEDAPPAWVPMPAPEAEAASRNADPAGQPILLVEDEAPLRQLAERALKRAGWEVVAAEDAEDALALLDQGLKPAILVSDVVMPGMAGTELAAELHRRLPRTPVLLVSGYAPAMVREGNVKSSTDYLSKPYRPAELVEAVGRCVKG